MEAGRIAGLDGLRGVAVSAVVVHHATAFLAPSLHATVMPGGFLGVDLFMVLSGYLITTILVTSIGSPSWAITFYKRRASRLLPALLALLGVLVVLTRIGLLEDAGDISGSILAALAYVFNYATLAGLVDSGYLGHLWSLSVEEQFYLVWPLVLVSCGRRRTPVTVGLILAVVVGRTALFASGVSAETLHFSTHARADALLIGAMLALAPRWRRWMAAGSLAGWAVLVSCMLLVRPGSALLTVGGYTIVALACATLVADVVERGGPSWLSWRPLTTIGLVSYGVYLWHFPVMRAIAANLGWTGVGGVFAGAVGTALATFGSWRFIESLFQARRRESQWSPATVRSNRPTPKRAPTLRLRRVDEV